MSSTLESGLKTYDWATDSTQSFVTGMNDNSAILDKSIKWNDQVKREFYKQMCKDVTSADGSDVTVSNGLNGYVLSGGISGNTVKCIYADNDWCTLTYTGTENISNAISMSAIPQAKISSSYVLVVDVKQNSFNNDFNVTEFNLSTRFVNETCKITSSKTGIFKFNITTHSNNSVVNFLLSKGNIGDVGTIVFRRCILEITDTNKVNSFLPFGLSSTTAQISNNGIAYPFYLTEADKTNKKPILLGGVNGVYDTLTVNEDGSGVLVQNTLQETFNGTQDFRIDSLILSECIVFKRYLGDKPTPTTSANMLMCDKFINKQNSEWNLDGEKVTIMNNKDFAVYISKTKLLTQDVAGFKTWLQSNPVTVRYQLTTPIVTTIPKEVMPCILTQLSNQFKVGDAVKASSYSLKVPTSDGVKSETNLTLLNGYVAVANSLTPVCRLTKDNRVEITLDCTSPSTFNATITSIPLNMRPLKDVRIIGFVDGVATPVTIKTTGEVQLPNSIVSKNVYIKDTYRLNAN